MSDILFWVGAAAASVVWIIVIIVTVLAQSEQFEKWQAEAVAHGAAEYYLDGNQAKWRWKGEAQ